MAKVRCKVCREYISKEDGKQYGLSWLCAEGQCQSDYLSPKLTKTPSKPKARKAPKKRNSTSKQLVPPEVAEHVLERDLHQCRLCGECSGLAIHHINYRSEHNNKPWENEPWNLITLCNYPCHLDVIHKDKNRYKRLLLGVTWTQYVEGRYVTIHDLERELESYDDSTGNGCRVSPDL